MDSYDAYECPCGGSGVWDQDPTLYDNHRGRSRPCHYCDGFGVIYVLQGYAPPRHAGKKIGESKVAAG